MRFHTPILLFFAALVINLQAADSEIITIPGTAPLTWPEEGAELSDDHTGTTAVIAHNTPR